MASAERRSNWKWFFFPFFYVFNFFFYLYLFLHFLLSFLSFLSGFFLHLIQPLVEKPWEEKIEKTPEIWKRWENKDIKTKPFDLCFVLFFLYFLIYFSISGPAVSSSFTRFFNRSWQEKITVKTRGPSLCLYLPLIGLGHRD